MMVMMMKNNIVLAVLSRGILSPRLLPRQSILYFDLDFFGRKNKVANNYGQHFVNLFILILFINH